MSVLIKGLQFPKDNAIAVVIHPDGTAYSSKMFAGVCTEYLTDCSAVPVSQHGRLIEDTAVREQIDEWLDSVGDVVVGHGLSYYGELLGCIEDAPTIIPAEEGES